MFKKERFVLSDVLSRYLKLNKSGKEHKALCPFHDEKTPSFTVNDEMRLWKCFGCGKSGDVYDFVAEIEKTDLSGAWQILHGEQEKVIRMKRKDALETARDWFKIQLKNNQKALAYIKQRGLNADKYDLGYAPEHYMPDDIDSEEIGLTGLFNNDRPTMRNRLIIPIYYNNELAGFTGRSLGTEEPKYLNSIDLKKGLYARYVNAQKPVYVTEGIIDCLALQSNGYEAISILGSHASDEQIHDLACFNDIILALDGDEAGYRGTLQIGKSLIAKGIHPAVANIPPGDDPDTLIKKQVKITHLPFLQFYLNSNAEKLRDKMEYILDVSISLTLPQRHYILTETSIFFGVEPKQLFAEAEQKRKEYEDRLRREALKESLVKALNDVTDKDPDDILRNINNANASGNVTPPMSFNEMIDDVVEQKKVGVNLNVISSGFKSLDRIMGGFRSGLYIICGRPSMGKSALAISMMLDNIIHGKRVLFFSLEMGYAEILERMLSILTGINHEAIRNNTIGQRRLLFNAACDILRTKNLIIRHDSKLQDLMLEAETNDWDIIYIDYLQLVITKGRSRQEEVAELSKTLKNISRQSAKPVVALSQLNRGIELRDDKRPTMADVRESGAIEQDADVMMSVFRESYYDKTKPEEELDVEVMKYRNGRTGKTTLFYDLQTQRINEW